MTTPGMRALLVALWMLVPAAAPACEVALVLAIDVSNSVDTHEYRLQADGLADALVQPEVIGALLRGQVALMVMQWSGVGQQTVTQDWARMTDLDDVLAFAAAARATPRAFSHSNTAPAEAIHVALNQFAAVPDCRHRVIDISGDGTPNAGSDTRAARAVAEQAGVTINAVAIESLGLAISGFYRRDVITTNGFVLTARGHRDYPDAIRAKLFRELTAPVG